jgi:hypothetical protein
MAPEVQKPSKWLCLTKLPREKYSQPIVHKALSWGSIRKSACILAEITIRKSQLISGEEIFTQIEPKSVRTSGVLTRGLALGLRPLARPWSPPPPTRLRSRRAGRPGAPAE